MRACSLLMMGRWHPHHLGDVLQHEAFRCGLALLTDVRRFEQFDAKASPGTARFDSLFCWI